MKHGDIYQHFKGGEYFFDCIALPKNDNNIQKSTKRNMFFAQTARYHDDTRDVKLYTSGGTTFIDSDVPHVIYQAEKDYDTPLVYAREVDDFFGFKHKDRGNLIKRFIKKA